MSFGPAKAAAETASARGRTHRLIEWPGEPGRSIALVVLTRKEIEQASLAAAKYLRAELKIDPIDLALVQSDLLHENERIIQTLAAALRQPECVDLRAFEPAALREAITAEEQNALVAAYNAFERERSPLTNAEDPEKALDEVIRLGKPEAQWISLQYCEVDSLRAIAICAVKRLTPQTSTSSSDT